MICYLAPQPPITELVLNRASVTCVPILVAFLRASGSTLKHLTVRFIRSEGAFPTPLPVATMTLTLARAVDEFIWRHGLEHGSPALRSITLNAPRFRACGPILEQLASPHVRLVSIELKPHVLVFGQGGFGLRQLGALFMRPPLARAKLRLVVEEEDLDVLLRLRETAREHLGSLWEGGRLDLWSIAAGSETEALLDAHEASAGEREAPFSFPWPPVDPFGGMMD